MGGPTGHPIFNVVARRLKGRSFRVNRPLGSETLSLSPMGPTALVAISARNLRSERAKKTT